MLQQNQYICMISILNLCLYAHTSVCVDADAHTPWRMCEGQRIASGVSTPHSHLIWDRIYYPTFLSPTPTAWHTRLAVPELPRVSSPISSPCPHRHARISHVTPRPALHGFWSFKLRSSCAFPSSRLPSPI